jgi:hypothetical protein
LNYHRAAWFTWPRFFFLASDAALHYRPDVDHKPSFWERQKRNSPIYRYWWLLPSILLAVFVYTGSISIWLALAGVAITLLAVIAHRLGILAKK